MNFGGPVWHASCALTQRRPTEEDKARLKDKALAALTGVGDRSQQWEQWTGYAYHVRRRLTSDEQRPIGEVEDRRGTDYAQERFAALEPHLSREARRWALQEAFAW